MKKIFTLLVACFSISSFSQNTVNYNPLTGIIANPDRGFYKPFDTFSDNYIALNQTELTGFRVNNSITMIYRGFYLNTFKNSTISDTYLANIQKDFDVIRNSGLKAVIRFAYSNNESDVPRDASKAIILSHLQQLKPLLTANADVIAVMQAGFIGTYGEWYNTGQADFGGFGFNNTALTPQNFLARKEVVDAILNALPTNRAVQIRTPYFKREMYTTTALTQNEAFNMSAAARIGHHNDCFLASATDFGTYLDTAVEYPYLEQETKFLPMGGETCALNSPRTDCPETLSEMKKFHWSYLNLAYNPDVIKAWQNGSCFAEINDKLGYRFQLNNATLPQSGNIGGTLAVTLKLQNLGFASPFNVRKVYLVLKNTSTNATFPILMKTDPRLWIGADEISISENLSIPANIASGSYNMYLSLPDSSSSIANKPEYAVRFANENIWDNNTGYNNLNNVINISTNLDIAENEYNKIGIFPVPANDQITINGKIPLSDIGIYNSVGEKQKLDIIADNENELLINTKFLKNGIYFINFKNQSVFESKKIIVKH